MHMCMLPVNVLAEMLSIVVLLKRMRAWLCVWRPVDVWAVGCVAGEMVTSKALFEGQSETDQLYLIVKCFGMHRKAAGRDQIGLGSVWIVSFAHA